MDDTEILEQVRALVAEEHDLRTNLGSGAISADDENRRLREVEEALDQCWDLLRQRRARRESGQDPSDAKVRSAREVEGYLQ